MVDKNLPKGICQRIDTSTYTVATAHEIPPDCSDTCKADKHFRKAHPFGPSADHIVPVSQLAPGDPRLTDPRALRLTHLICNIKRKDGGNEKPAVETLKDWEI